MFNERKVLEEIIYLLKLNNNQLNELKLMKELYLADRLSIKERGHSISFDSFFSLPHGPILSNTLNLLNTEGIWDDYISKVEKDY
ncbi:MAG: SocA family protein, partial [Rickettsiales bacterium]|nr:SocA family protein [Rickettsiales bacterium]